MKFTSIIWMTFATLFMSVNFAQEGVKIFGYTDIEYMDMGKMPMVMTMTDSMGMVMEKLGYMDEMNSFMAHRFNILLKSDFAEGFVAFANIEFLHAFDSEENLGSLALEEGWFQYTYSEALKIKGGTFLTSFGSFNKIHNASPTYWSIRPPMFFDEMYDLHLIPDKANIEFSGSLGERGRLDYNIHLSNGEGVDENGMDLNSTRSVGGRVGTSLIDGLILGVSGHIDKELEPAGEDMGHSEENETSEETDVQLIGLDFSYTILNFKVYGEYYNGEYETGQITFNRTGYFVVAGYTFFDKMTPFVELDYFKDPNDFIYKNKLSRTTIGINYKVNWRVAVKLEAHNHTYATGDIKAFSVYQAAVSVLY